MENSDEPYADRIAKAVIQVFRRGGTVDTTRQLYALIEGALSFLPAGEAEGGGEEVLSADLPGAADRREQ